MKNTLIIILFLFMNSCSDEFYDKNRLDPESSMIISSGKLKSQSYLNLGVYKSSKDSFVYILDREENFSILDLDCNTKTDFDFSGLHRYGKISSICVKDSSSVIVTFKDKTTIYDYNFIENQIDSLESINYSEFVNLNKVKENDRSTHIQFLPSNLDPIRLIGDYLYIPLEHYIPLNPNSVSFINDSEETQKIIETIEKEYLKYSNDFSYLKNDASYLRYCIRENLNERYHLISGLMPDEYYQSESYLPIGLMRSSCYSKNDELIVSYYCSHSIALLNLSNGDVKRQTLKSKYIDNFNTIQLKDIKSKSKERLNTEPFYAGIYYDQYKERYYRIAVHRQDNLTPNKIKLNKFEDRTWSLIVADKDLNILNEYFFEGNKYLWNSIFITAEGLFIKSLQNSNDSLVFKQFDFENY